MGSNARPGLARLAKITAAAWLLVACGLASQLLLPPAGERLGLVPLLLVDLGPLSLPTWTQIFLLWAILGSCSVGWFAAGRGFLRGLVLAGLGHAALVYSAVRRPAEMAWHVALATLILLLGSHLLRKVRARAASTPRAVWAAALLLPIAALLPVLFPVAARFAAGPAADQRPAQLPSVLFIVVDTMRAEFLSLHGYARPTTPALEQLAESSAVFLRAYSPAPWTVPAHASLFTGLDPAQHGAGWEHMRLDDEFVTLAERLHALGYETSGISENPLVSERTGFAQGFERFVEMSAVRGRSLPTRALEALAERLGGPPRTREHTRASLALARLWLAWREPQERPAFLFLNLMAPHLPNYHRSAWSVAADQRQLARIEPVNLVPERFYLPEHALGPQDLAVMRALYEGELHHVDRELGTFLSGLEASGVLDSLLLVVTSDHGENFGDHAFIEHQYCLYDTLLHVPLLIRYPQRVPGGRKIAHSVSTLRVADTILDLIGEAGPLVSLLQQERPEPLFAETERMPPEKLGRVLQDKFSEVANRRFQHQLRSVRAGGYKLVAASDGHEELYHVAVDPLELQDSITSAPETAARLRLLLSGYEKRRRPRRERPSEIDPETRDALKALGYVE